MLGNECYDCSLFSSYINMKAMAFLVRLRIGVRGKYDAGIKLQNIVLQHF